MKFGKIKAFVASLLITSTIIPAGITAPAVSASYGTGKNVVEYLDRGISAINTGSGMHVSWRFLANDPDDAVFKLYRDNNLIYTSENGKATSFLDKSGNSGSKYKVEVLSGGKIIGTDECGLVSDQSYFNIPLDIPKGGSDYSYTAGDCSTGDVDGDGQYEIFVKWDPTNAKDNSQSGYTGNVYIDCYTLEGKKLWRVDLGKNIRAGAHYTQFLVADFDLDGNNNSLGNERMVEQCKDHRKRRKSAALVRVCWKQRVTKERVALLSLKRKDKTVQSYIAESNGLLLVPCVLTN